MRNVFSETVELCIEWLLWEGDALKLFLAILFDRMLQCQVNCDDF